MRTGANRVSTKVSDTMATLASLLALLLLLFGHRGRMRLLLLQLEQVAMAVLNGRLVPRIAAQVRLVLRLLLTSVLASATAQ